MRISTSSMTQNMSDNIKTNMKKYQDLQNRISAGGQMTAPSEDPLAYAYVNKLKDARTQIGNYGDVAGRLMNDLNFYDTQFQQSTDLLKNIRNVALRAANGTTDSTDAENLAKEVNANLSQLVAVGNSNVQGKYMFSGSKNVTQPFKTTSNGDWITNVSYMGDSTTLSREVGFNDKMKVTYTGEEVYANDSGNGVNVYREVIALRDDILSGNAQNITSHLDAIDNAINQVSGYRTLNGNKIKHLENLEMTWKELDINYAQSADKVGTQDMATLINALNTQQLSYQSTLYIAGSMGKLSILNYLQ